MDTGYANTTNEIAQLTQKADQGDPKAQYNLGSLYEHGNGVPKDPSKAIEYFTKSADQGDAAAQYSLGMFYLKGEGVPKDLPKAKKYFQQACSNKNQNGCKMYNTLTK